jgi:hypothetical protein
VIDVRSPAIAHSVTAEEIDRLPKQRSFQWIALTAPSVNQGDVEGGFQVNGASGAENAFTVDGVNTTSLINGTFRHNTLVEYVQEVQVKRSGIPAEYAGALGGVISAVTKSGGNTLAGEGHYHADGSALSTGPVKRLVLDPSDDKSVHYTQDAKMPDHRHEAGAALGGPVVKDKVFFFASFSPRRGTRTNSYRFSSGAEEGALKRTARLMHTFAKISYTSRRVNAHSSTLATRLSVAGTLPVYNGVAANSLSSSKSTNSGNQLRGWQSVQANSMGHAGVIASRSSLAALRGGIFHDKYADAGVPLITSYTYRTVATRGLPLTILGPIGTQNSPRTLITIFDTTKRHFFNADYYHNLRGAGRHGVKGGFGIERAVNNVNQSFPGGYVDIFWDSTLNLPNHPADRGVFGYYTVTNRGTIGRAGANILSLYVQDEWQPTARLTMNLGIRAESEKVPSFRQELQKYVINFRFIDKIAPRIGISYGVLGDRQARIYGSYGRYYDWTKYAISRSVFGGDTWCVYYRSIDDPPAPLAAHLADMPGRDLWRGGGGCRDFRTPNFGIIDPNTKPMSQDSVTAGVDVELNSSTVARIHVVHNDLKRTIEDVVALVNGTEKYLVGNPGEGSASIMPASAAPLTGGGSFPMPKAKRHYDALELGVSRRLANNWFASANLTISRLHGNYAGLASSDEIRTPATGVSSATAQQQAGSIFREGGNVNRGWDLDTAMFDSHGTLDVRGRLATDRPVVAKFYGGYTLARNTQFGAFVYVGSGTPVTTIVNTVNQAEVFVNGRGDMGRTPVLTRTDLLVSHELRIARIRRLRLEANVLNLFNQKTARHIFNYLNRGAGDPRPSSAIDVAPFDLFKGYDYNALIRGTSDGANAYDPRYGMPDLFETGTQGQVSVKVLF